MFIFFLAVSLIFDKEPSVRSLGAGESGMPCASFSLVSCKEKDALFLKTEFGCLFPLKNSAPLRYSTHTGLGQSARQRWPGLMRSHTSVEKQAGPPPLVWCRSQQGSLLPPTVLPPGALPRACVVRQATGGRWRPLFCCSVLHQMIPNLWVSFGTLSKRVSSF